MNEKEFSSPSFCFHWKRSHDYRICPNEEDRRGRKVGILGLVCPRIPPSKHPMRGFWTPRATIHFSFLDVLVSTTFGCVPPPIL